MKSSNPKLILATGLVVMGFSLAWNHRLHADEPVEDLLLGGTGTVFEVGADAFALPLAGLRGLDRLEFSAGNALFTNAWVIAPASTQGRDGLGPLLNARACAGCHVNDGRGAPAAAEGGEPTDGLLLRISAATAHAYGDQLQNQAIPGVPAEVSIRVDWHKSIVNLADGSVLELRKPSYSFSQLAYGPLPEGLQISPRLAPQMIGLGLLEAVDPAHILEAADADDKNQDGISGRANFVQDLASGQLMLGRFGWKANQPSLRQQNAGAFLGDMGLTSSLFAQENCTDTQTACKAAPTGGSPEVTDSQLDSVEHYTRFLAVPARRNTHQAEVVRGRELFFKAQCQSCHRPTMTTGSDAVHPLLVQQKIWPYTDLLLHDMGEDLADHRADGLADGFEWRTPPLWGIGLSEKVNRHGFYLHDGRARTLEEAILWHGGEASASRKFYQALSASERSELQAFLRSL